MGWTYKYIQVLRVWTGHLNISWYCKYGLEILIYPGTASMGWTSKYIQVLREWAGKIFIEKEGTVKLFLKNITGQTVIVI